MKKIFLLAVFLFAVSVAPALAFTIDTLNPVRNTSFEITECLSENNYIYFFLDGVYFNYENCADITELGSLLYAGESFWSDVIGITEIELIETAEICEEYTIESCEIIALDQKTLTILDLAEVPAMAKTMVDKAKENIFAILSVNIDVLALIVVAIWVIYLAFKFIKKAIA